MQVTAIDSVFDASVRRRDLAVPPRSSIADMVAAAFPGAPMALRRDIIVATVNGETIPVEAWASVRPKVGTVVMLRPVPQNDLLRSALLVAVTVAAIAAGQFLAPLLIPSLVVGTGGVQIGAAIITSTVLFAGTALVNALVPLRKDDKDKPTYAVQGLKNQLTPDGVVPLILGRVRYAPPYVVKPWTQSIGDDRYVTAAVGLYGPLVMRNWRIGKTAVERYKDVVFETRQGYPGDARLTLTPNQAIETSESIALLTALSPTGGPNIRTTASDVTHCEVDTSYPGGVYAVNEDGESQNFTVLITTRYRLAGNDATPWTAGPAITVTSKKNAQITRTTRIDFPARGRYEVELTRVTDDWDEVDQSKKKIRRYGRSFWVVLRSFRPEYPIAFPKPLTLAAIRIRASGQLQGIVDELNAEFSSICPDWDEPTSSWIDRETNNPASLFRYVLTGPGITYPLTPTEIAALGQWHAFCVLHGLTYNRVHDYPASVYDVLSDVAAAGRAAPHNGGTAWGVVIDRAMDYVAAHIGPRNSYNYTQERSYVRFPDAFRVSFLDETNDYQPAERIVPWPGFVGDPVVIEKIDMPGITNPSTIWRETRRRQYELIHRRDTFTVQQDWESLASQRGDPVRLSHSVIDRIMASGRVRRAAGSQVVLDCSVTMEAGKTYAVRFRRPGGATLVRSVKTVPGTTQVLILTGTGDLPSAGDDAADPPIPPDLAFFGQSGQETLACTVKGIESIGKFSSRLTLVEHAPQIEALVAAEVPPPWSGRAGGEAGAITTAPLPPTITDVVSGIAAAEYATAGNPNPLLVTLREDSLTPVQAATFLVRHRLAATVTWAGPVSVPANAGLAVIPGYTPGQQVQMQAAAVSAAGVASPYGNSVTHTVASADPVAPVNLKVTTERRVVSGTTTADILRLTCDPPADPSFILVGFYRAVGATTWLDMKRDSDNLYSLVSPDIVFGQLYEVEGLISTPAGARRGPRIDATPATISAPIYTADFQTATYVGGGAPTITRASSGYAANSGGAYALFAADTLRRTNVGLTVEEAITNVVRNNSMQGAVAGTPGTLPTTWTIFNEGNGLTRQIVGTGTENGIDYIDLRYFGTVTAGTIIAIDVEPGYPAAVGQLWTYSNFVKLVGGSLANVTIARHIRETGGGSNGITETPFVPTSGSLGPQRGSISRTLTVAGSTAIIGRLYIFTTTGTTIDLTLRIGWPQTERRDNLGVVAARASSPIRTTGSAVTRAADVVTLPITGASRVVLTYSDGTTQEFTGINPATAWTIPAASLTRSIITKLAAHAS